LNKPLRCKLGFHNGKTLGIKIDTIAVWNCENIDYYIHHYYAKFECRYCHQEVETEISHDEFRRLSDLEVPYYD